MNQRKTSRESCLGLCNENRRLKLLVDRQIKSICCNRESQHKKKNAKRTPQNTRYALIRGGCISSPHSVGLYARVNTLIFYQQMLINRLVVARLQLAVAIRWGAQRYYHQDLHCKLLWQLCAAGCS